MTKQGAVIQQGGHREAGERVRGWWILEDRSEQSRQGGALIQAKARLAGLWAESCRSSKEVYTFYRGEGTPKSVNWEKWQDAQGPDAVAGPT